RDVFASLAVRLAGSAERLALRLELPSMSLDLCRRGRLERADADQAVRSGEEKVVSVIAKRRHCGEKSPLVSLGRFAFLARDAASARECGPEVVGMSSVVQVPVPPVFFRSQLGELAQCSLCLL